uniref:hypothetical protein n=1 Tax=Pseudonocardia nigra TaxID=1921578 RepID=UPI001C5CD585
EGAGAVAAAEELRAGLAAAAAVDRAGVRLWWEQLAAARRLDDELGASGAAELVRAQVEQLDTTLTHTVPPPARAAVAAVLSAAAALAGAQELDRARPDLAWRRYDRARTAAEEARVPAAQAVALAGQAAVLVDVGEPAAAIALLHGFDTEMPHAAQARLAAASGLASAAAGDGDGARHGIAGAERALRRTVVDVAAPPQEPAVELADLHRWHGRTLVTLGDAAAVHPLRQALTAGPRSARHRAAVHADLAIALAADRPDEAAEHARRARELAAGIGSHRIPARLSALGRPR